MVLGFEWYKDFNGIGTFLIILFYFISFVLGSDREFAFIHSFIRETNYGRIAFSDFMIVNHQAIARMVK